MAEVENCTQPEPRDALHLTSKAVIGRIAGGFMKKFTGYVLAIGFASQSGLITARAEVVIQEPQVFSTVVLLPLGSNEELNWDRKIMVTVGNRDQPYSRSRIGTIHLDLEEASTLSKDAHLQQSRRRPGVPCDLLHVHQPKSWIQVPAAVSDIEYYSKYQQPIQICTYSKPFQYSSDPDLTALSIESTICNLSTTPIGEIQVSGQDPIQQKDISAEEVGSNSDEEILERFGCDVIHKRWSDPPR